MTSTTLHAAPILSLLSKSMSQGGDLNSNNNLENKKHNKPKHNSQALTSANCADPQSHTLGARFPPWAAPHASPMAPVAQWLPEVPRLGRRSREQRGRSGCRTWKWELRLAASVALRHRSLAEGQAREDVVTQTSVMYTAWPRNVSSTWIPGKEMQVQWDICTQTLCSQHILEEKGFA